MTAPIQKQKAYLNKIESINLGSFYTPLFVVEIARKMLSDFLQKTKQNPKDLILLDSSCGYGSFLQSRDSVDFQKVIGADIDKEALNVARENLKETATLLLHKNALQEASRWHFGITESSKLIIIGNPPYNDKTSIVQRHLKDKSCSVDSALKARDIGISFLRSYAMLGAHYICVLHPLSYLIKESNFKALKSFASNYRLLDSLVISSQIFCPKSSGYFPILIALYAKNQAGMDYHFIQNYTFKTLEKRQFCLKDYDFIAKYVDKYPKKSIKDSLISSQKVAMFYTLRDINALKRSRTFLEKPNANTIYVSQEKYSLYCYIDVFKQMLAHIPYYFGNCDVFIDYEKFKPLESYFVESSQNKIPSPVIKQYFKELLGEHYED